ncbi:MAG: hypothetical protein PUF51_03485 [Bifidobacteriaceae bacterium]|nr:hypothetical protein [Bifidobacteriaceae bacterium]
MTALKRNAASDSPLGAGDERTLVSGFFYAVVIIATVAIVPTIPAVRFQSPPDSIVRFPTRSASFHPNA